MLIIQCHLPHVMGNKKSSMQFELLPNEIILDIFSYMNAIDLLHGFYGLNTRFTCLLSHQSHYYRFNFANCSKIKFDMICQQYLPLVAKQILYLSLEDCGQTPGQIDLFLSYLPSLNSFISLRSLKISEIYSNSILIQIINQLYNLSNLTHLEFYSCHCQDEQTDIQLLMNQIWTLPKLTDLRLDIHFKNQTEFSSPTNISKSIKILLLYYHRLTYNEMKQLVQYTPYLQHLYTYFDINTYEDDQSNQFLTLTYLLISAHLFFDTSKMILFLQNLSNLHELSVYFPLIIINGYQWEQLIENYLPRLKKFEFLMREEYLADRNIEERADQLLNSFRSSFWIDKHKWFVRYIVHQTTIHFETMISPYTWFGKYFPYLWKSTNSTDDFQKRFNTITSIRRPMCWNQSISLPVQFTNIEDLSIEFPIHDRFWSIVSNLNQLKSLQIFNYNDSFQSQLQTLFDHASNLTSLTIIRQSESLPLQTSVFKCRNRSIQKLDLINYNYRFNEKECLKLSHSSLCVQCQILSIQVKNRQSILILIENMINLRVLNTQYNNENSNEVIQWLKDRLPSTCLITKNLKSINSIRIWMR